MSLCACYLDHYFDDLECGIEIWTRCPDSNCGLRRVSTSSFFEEPLSVPRVCTLDLEMIVASGMAGNSSLTSVNWWLGYYLLRHASEFRKFGFEEAIVYLCLSYYVSAVVMNDWHLKAKKQKISFPPGNRGFERSNLVCTCLCLCSRMELMYLSLWAEGEKS